MPPTRRIGIDTHVLSGRYQGSRTYLANLVPAIARAATPDEQIILYGGRVPPASLNANAVSEIPVRSFRCPTPLLRIPLEIPWLEHRDRLDVFHSQYICPPFSRAAEVVTIHDLLFETNPEWFPRPFVARMKWLCRQSAGRASVILTVSQYSADVIHDRYRIPLERIGIIPHGADHVPMRDARRGDESWFRFRELHSLPEEYLLFVGRIDPRKNVVGLARALAAMRSRNVQVPPLLVVGQPDHRGQAILGQAMRMVAPGRISTLGNVTDAELPELYRHARAVVHPSFAEGFGLPVLEAMAAGAIVLTSLSGAIREFASGCVIEWDSYSVEDMAAALTALLEGRHDEASLRKEAECRARAYRWSHAGAATLEWYRRASA